LKFSIYFFAAEITDCDWSIQDFPPVM